MHDRAVPIDQPAPQPPKPWTGHGVSLLSGWLPLTIQLVAVVVLLVVIGWRHRTWRTVWLPVCLLIGIAAGVAGLLAVRFEGLESDPAPDSVWFWTGGTGLAVAVAVIGFRSARWWRRILSLPAIALAVVATVVVLNQWVGYFPTAQAAWNALTAAPMPDSVAGDALPGLRNTPMTTGKVVEIDTGDAASGFRHRDEYVYLPPAWFAGDEPPHLPAVMMIGGEFNTPADWIRSGDVIDIADSFAAAHDGHTPILVFVDAGGTFNNDTECVDGPRGNSHEHLIDDVRPYVIDHFGVPDRSSAWGVVGFSMGGTCALDMAVMQPDDFAAFEDIAGDIGPSAGTKDQTIDRLYGGDAAQWDAFDPQTVMNRHGRYANLAGWFADPGPQPSHGPGTTRPVADQDGIGGIDTSRTQVDPAAPAVLCAAGRAVGIDCQVHTDAARHSWQFAAASFAEALPWFSGQLVNSD